MMKEQSIENFIDALASKEPVPGGGGAASLGGAIGIALGSMVGNLTLGKKKYAHVEEDIKVLLDKAERLQEEMLGLIDKDADAFEPLAKAYRLPKETEEQRNKKDLVMEEALLKASLVPLEIMEKSLSCMEILNELEEKGTQIAISDIGVGIQFCKAALLSASMNVFINTKSMKNKEQAESINQQANLLIKNGGKRADTIFQNVMGRIL